MANRSTFIDHLAAAANADILYATDSGVYFKAELARFAQHVVAATATKADDESDFYGRATAIYGQWGAGKSTALAYLRKLIADEMTRQRRGTGDIRWVTFDAREWEHYGHARQALTFGITTGLGLDDFRTLQRMRTHFGQKAALMATERRAVIDRSLLEDMGSVPQWPLVEKAFRGLVAERVFGTAAEKDLSAAAGIVIVENLDRCEARFVCDLLAAMDGWLQDPAIRLFFLLASSKEHLIHALTEVRMGQGTPAQTLEKYVHTEIHVPSFLQDDTEVAAYLAAVLEHERDAGQSAADSPETQEPAAFPDPGTAGAGPDEVASAGQIDRVRAAVLEVLEAVIKKDKTAARLSVPLLRSPDSQMTPRRAVDRLNKLITSLNPESLGQQYWLTREGAANLKRDMLRAFYPDFYDRIRGVYLLESAPSADAAESPAGLALSLIRDVGDILSRSERLRIRADQSGRALLDALALALANALPGDPPVTVTADLAKYLASPPSWPPQHIGPDLRTGQPADPSEPMSSKISDFASARGSDFASARGNADEAQRARGAGTPENEFMRRYLEGDSALDQGDAATAEAELDRLVALVQQFPESFRDAAQVGNAAILAERLRQNGPALYLHIKANEIDPEHANVALNYAEFLLDDKHFTGQLGREFPREARWRQAASLLAGLEARHAEYKPWRRAELLERLAQQLGETPDASRVEVIKEYVRTERSMSAFLALVRLYPQAITFKDLSDFARLVVESHPEDSARVVRLVADQAAEADDERVATDIYLWLFQTGLVDAREEPFKHDTWNNLAFSLRSSKFPNAALRCFAKMLLEYPSSNETRVRFARMLAGADRSQLAKDVFDGKALGIRDLAELPDPEDVPALPTPTLPIDAWWRDLPDRGPGPVDPILRGHPGATEHSTEQP